MSNHFSADYLKSPGDDRRLDITDVFLFKSSKDGDKMLLIANSNPTAPAPKPVQARGPEFYPGAVYRINVDTDGDALADVAFSFTFSEYQGGRQTGTAWHATGPQARQPEPAGEVLAESIPVSFDGMAPPVQAGGIRLLAGRRSDPFFADVEGTLHGFAWTGHDDFAGNNVTSIELEVPADMLFTGPQIGVWASISRRRGDGTLEQMDRGRKPDAQPIHQPRRGKRPLQLPAARRRRGQLPRAMVQDPRRRRLPARRCAGGRPAGAARHPALRPHQAPL